MRGVIAKRIRKAVYGTKSLRQERKYTKMPNGVIRVGGDRGRYLKAKRLIKRK